MVERAEPSAERPLRREVEQSGSLPQKFRPMLEEKPLSPMALLGATAPAEGIGASPLRLEGCEPVAAERAEHRPPVMTEHLQTEVKGPSELADGTHRLILTAPA